MSRMHLSIAIVLGVLLSIVIFISSQAQETIVTTTATPSSPTVIVTPVPAPKETIVTPEGYTNCFTVDAGWYNNTWIPAHKVCQYTQSTTSATTYEGTAWIEGYWACNTYTNQECTNWVWKPGRWVKTLEVY